MKTFALATIVVVAALYNRSAWARSSFGVTQLPPQTKPSNILAFLPTEAKSHFISFKPLLETLVSRGHNVTLVSPFSLDGAEKPYRYVEVERTVAGGPNAEYFRNPKGWFSFNVQTVVSAGLKIMDIVARWPGSTHDSTIFSNSKISQNLHIEKKWGNRLIVADSGYANTNHIVTPFLNPQVGAENLYNESHIRTRNPVERSYGVWKR